MATCSEENLKPLLQDRPELCDTLQVAGPSEMMSRCRKQLEPQAVPTTRAHNRTHVQAFTV